MTKGPGDLVGVVLPDALAFVLNMIGVDWPNIDEDKLRDGADQMRQLSSELTSNTGDAKSSIEQMLSQNSSQSLAIFEGLWQKLANGHLPQLAEGLKVVATGLDGSALLVTGMKIAAIGQLAILAAEIIADQAAAPFTFGASEAAIPAEAEVTSQVVKQIFKKVVDQVEQLLLNALEGPVFMALGNAAMELGEQLLGDVAGTSSGIDLGSVIGAGGKGLGDAVGNEVHNPGSIIGLGGSESGSAGEEGGQGTETSGDVEVDRDATPRMGPGLELGSETSSTEEIDRLEPSQAATPQMGPGLELSSEMSAREVDRVEPLQAETVAATSRTEMSPEMDREVDRVEPMQARTMAESRVDPVEPLQAQTMREPRMDQFAPLQSESTGVPAHLGPGLELPSEPRTDQVQPTWPEADEVDTAPRLAPGIKVNTGSELA
jgi:hypothetical protein